MGLSDESGVHGIGQDSCGTAQDLHDSDESHVRKVPGTRVGSGDMQGGVYAMHVREWGQETHVLV